MQEAWVQSLDWEHLLEKEWQPTPVFLPGKSHGQRSLVDMSLSELRELVTDWEAWRAAIHGVTKSRTGLSD